MNISNENWCKLIDLVRDLNKSLSMHIDNHNTKSVDDAIMRVGTGISSDLEDLENATNPEKTNK